MAMSIWDAAYQMGAMDRKTWLNGGKNASTIPAGAFDPTQTGKPPGGLIHAGYSVGAIAKGGSKVNKEFAGLGLALGTVRGVRAFEVDSLGRLTGVSYKKVWKPGENEAECKYRERIESRNMSVKTDEYGTKYYVANEVALYNGTYVGPHEGSFEYSEHDMSTCSCGYHAYYDGSNDYHKPGETVTAVVEGYGETVIGTRGFRAAKAKILALHIPGYEPESKKEAVRATRKTFGEWFFKHVKVLQGWATGVGIFTGGTGIGLGGTWATEGHEWAGYAALAVLPVFVLTVAMLFYGDHLISVNKARQTASKTLFDYEYITGKKKPELPQIMRDRVLRNYAGIPVFGSFDEMIEAFPPDRGVDPSPDTDPEFWERSA